MILSLTIVRHPDAPCARKLREYQFGRPEVVVIEELPRPGPGAGELLVRVQAAGVAPWDAIIREGKSKVSPKPPSTLGSDLFGVVEAAGDDVTGFRAKSFLDTAR